MEIIVYTKHDCESCAALKSYLKENQLNFTEKDIETQEVVEELIQSSFIIENFCDENECIEITRIVKIDGNWLEKEIFEEGTLSEGTANVIFKVSK